jgi:hypothetical protein
MRLQLTAIGSLVKTVIDDKKPTIIPQTHPFFIFSHVNENDISTPMHPARALALSEISLNGSIPTSYEEFDELLALVFPKTIEPAESSLAYYTAFLTQSGTNNPVATVAHSSIGNITWTRESVGRYKGFCLDAFPSITTKAVIGGGTISKRYSSFMFEDESTIIIETILGDGTIEGSELTDGQLSNTFFQIRSNLLRALH